MKVEKNVGGDGLRHLGYGAVLTGLDGLTSVIADPLEVQALGLEHSRNAQGYMSVSLVWDFFVLIFVELMGYRLAPLVNGTNQCETCMGADVHSHSDGNRRIEVTASVPSSLSAGHLYLAEYSY